MATERVTAAASDGGEFAACVGPANGTSCIETGCVGGLVIARQIRAIGAFSTRSTLPGRTYTCEIFGSLTSPVLPSVVSALPDPVAAARAHRDRRRDGRAPVSGPEFVSYTAQVHGVIVQID